MLSVLVLCTGNSARSILAEALFAQAGSGRIAAYSAGSQPKTKPHSMAMSVLKLHGHGIERFRSKSWSEFGQPDSPNIDIVITVCDSAARESCPVWPGAPASAHWGLPDPATLPDDLQQSAFEQTYEKLKKRVDAVLALPLENMSSTELRKALMHIHEKQACLET